MATGQAPLPKQSAQHKQDLTRGCEPLKLGEEGKCSYGGNREGRDIQNKLYIILKGLIKMVHKQKMMEPRLKEDTKVRRLAE